MIDRRTGLWWIRLTFGVVLLAFLLSRADLSALAENLSRVHPGWLALMVFVPHVGILVSAVKWRILLRDVGVSAPMSRLFVLYLIGTFFNNFLPSMIGGDAVRAYQLHREKRDASGILAATFMERYVGLAGLFTLVLLAFFDPTILEGAPWLPGVASFSVGAYVLATAFLFSRHSSVLGRWSESGGLVGRVSRTFGRTRDRMMTFRSTHRTLLFSYAISVLFYFLAAYTVWLACRAVGVSVGLLFLTVAVPTVLLAGLLPISVNGLGITEGGYVLFLGLAGVSTVDALTVALLVRGRILLTAVIGGICFLSYRPGEPRIAPDA